MRGDGGRRYGIARRILVAQCAVGGSKESLSLTRATSYRLCLRLWCMVNGTCNYLH